jgi:hypothetical protein
MNDNLDEKSIQNALVTGLSLGCQSAIKKPSQGHHRIITGLSKGSHRVVRGQSKVHQRAITGISQGGHGIVTGLSQAVTRRSLGSHIVFIITLHH